MRSSLFASPPPSSCLALRPAPSPQLPGQGRERGVHRNKIPQNTLSSRVFFSLLFPSYALLSCFETGGLRAWRFCAHAARADLRGAGACLGWVGRSGVLRGLGVGNCGPVTTRVGEDGKGDLPFLDDGRVVRHGCAGCECCFGVR